MLEQLEVSKSPYEQFQEASKEIIVMLDKLKQDISGVSNPKQLNQGSSE